MLQSALQRARYVKKYLNTVPSIPFYKTKQVILGFVVKTKDTAFLVDRHQNKAPRQ